MDSLPPIITKSSVEQADLESLAGALARLIMSGDVIAIKGNLGSGKTTFAKAFIHSLMNKNIEVTSPTYTLMQSYPVILSSGKSETLWHLDLYRLQSTKEVETLGLEELERHIMLIEWPEIIENTLPASRLEITLAFGQSEKVRDMIIAGGEDWRQRLKGFFNG